MQGLFAHDGKKRDILEASLKLFAGRGYDAVSVRDVSKAAGVSEAALYKHFKGKAEMARYIFESVISEYTRRVGQIDADVKGAVNKLCRIVEMTYDLYREYPAEIRFALLSQYQFWDQVNEDVKPHFLFRRILEEGMDQGEISRQEVYFWIAVYSGVMLQPLSQYTYFYDVLPEYEELKKKVADTVRKLFGKEAE